MPSRVHCFAKFVDHNLMDEELFPGSGEMVPVKEALKES